MATMTDLLDIDNALAAWCVLFSKTNQVLAGHPVPVEIAPAMSEVAATDGAIVRFGKVPVTDMMIRDFDRDPAKVTRSLKGLNYHELAHVILSPREDEKSMRAVKVLWADSGHDDMVWRCFNILEDGRIETRVTQSWNVEPYFTSAVAEWILNESDDDGLASTDQWQHLLLHGRRYLPKALRDAGADTFKHTWGQELLDRVSSIIDQYVDIQDLNAEAKLTVKLIEELYEILKQQPDMQPPCSSSPSDQRSDDTGDAGDEPKQMQKGESGGVPGEAGAEERAAQQAEGDEDGEGSKGEGGGESKDRDDLTYDEAVKADGYTEKGDTNEVAVPLSEVLRQQAQAALETASLEVALDLDSTIKAFRATADSLRYDLRRMAKAGASSAPVPAADRSVAARVTQVLRELRDELEANWVAEQRQGRVHARRYVVNDERRPGDFRVFNRWEPGNEDEGSVEVVVALDRSVSMAGDPIIEASRAAWIIKSSMHDLDIPVSVLVYDTACHVGYESSEPVYNDKMKAFHSAGSTSPGSTLTTALHILKGSKAAHRFCIVLTDGQWGSTLDDDAVKALRAEGVLVALFGIDDAVDQYGAHDANVAADLQSVLDLPNAVQALVAASLRQSQRLR